MNMPRLITALITPFDENLQVHYTKAAELAEYLVENGTQGIVVSGTTGESPLTEGAALPSQSSGWRSCLSVGRDRKQ